jgi:hypothetical protein
LQSSRRYATWVKPHVYSWRFNPCRVIDIDVDVASRSAVLFTPPTGAPA